MQSSSSSFSLSYVAMLTLFTKHYEFSFDFKLFNVWVNEVNLSSLLKCIVILVQIGEIEKSVKVLCIEDLNVTDRWNQYRGIIRPEDESPGSSFLLCLVL